MNSQIENIINSLLYIISQLHQDDGYCMTSEVQLFHKMQEGEAGTIIMTYDEGNKFKITI